MHKKESLKTLVHEQLQVTYCIPLICKRSFPLAAYAIVDVYQELLRCTMYLHKATLDFLPILFYEDMEKILIQKMSPGPTPTYKLSIGIHLCTNLLVKCLTLYKIWRKQKCNEDYKKWALATSFSFMHYTTYSFAN